MGENFNSRNQSQLKCTLLVAEFCGIFVKHTQIPAMHFMIGIMLMHLMDARDITTEALAEVIGSLEVALQIVNGDRTISKIKAEALANYFHVDASLFT